MNNCSWSEAVHVVLCFILWDFKPPTREGHSWLSTVTVRYMTPGSANNLTQDKQMVKHGVYKVIMLFFPNVEAEQLPSTEQMLVPHPTRSFTICLKTQCRDNNDFEVFTFKVCLLMVVKSLVLQMLGFTVDMIAHTICN